MIFTHIETGNKLETDNTNLFSMLEREGYEPVAEEASEEAKSEELQEVVKLENAELEEEEVKPQIEEQEPKIQAEEEGNESAESSDVDKKAELIAQAKELGIKATRSMKIETIKEKIMETQSKQ